MKTIIRVFIRMLTFWRLQYFGITVYGALIGYSGRNYLIQRVGAQYVGLGNDRSYEGHHKLTSQS
ncbi:MAG: hypothetical protein AB2608_18740, partial [Candidatus Thiodiazotropha sp.]